MAERQRSLSAMVATRADPARSSSRPEPAPPARPSQRSGILYRLPWQRIGMVTSWLILAVLIAALWGSLLLGDSLLPPAAE